MWESILIYILFIYLYMCVCVCVCVYIYMCVCVYIIITTTTPCCCRLPGTITVAKKSLLLLKWLRWSRVCSCWWLEWNRCSWTPSDAIFTQSCKTLFSCFFVNLCERPSRREMTWLKCKLSSTESKQACRFKRAKHVDYALTLNKNHGRVSAHGMIGRRSTPYAVSCSNQCSTTSVTKAILSVGWCI